MFIEQRLLDCVAYGSEFGSEWNTRIVALKNGAERRNANWQMPLGRYSIVYSALDAAGHRAVYHAHMACRGRWAGFRLRDWRDYIATNAPVTTATGGEQTAQLQMAYTFGPTTFYRDIYKPVFADLFADGIPIPAVVDATTGLATFTASEGQVITWSGEFDVPVRFDDDRLDVTPLTTDADQGFVVSSDASLTEIRP